MVHFTEMMMMMIMSALY